MASLYEEQIRAADTAYALYTGARSNRQAEASSYFPELVDYDGGVSGHLETPARQRRARLQISGSFRGALRGGPRRVR
jgi:hypothetical protein